MLAKLFTAKNIKKSGYTSATHAEKGFPGQKIPQSQNSYLFQSIPLLKDLTGFLACLVPFYASFELAWWRGSPEQRVNLAEGAVVPLGLGSERWNLFSFLRRNSTQLCLRFSAPISRTFAQFSRTASTQPLNSSATYMSKKAFHAIFALQ